jgi:hypothetical protein
MTQEERLIALANALGADIKAARIARGDLTALSTTAKSNLVAAINEVRQIAIDASGGTGGASIDDTATNGATSVTWSADKIFDSIEAAKIAVKNDLTAGASSAYDTFQELQALLEADETLTASLADAVSKRVRYDAAQTLTVAEKLQACTNIGIGDPDSDFVAVYNTAKA